MNVKTWHCSLRIDPSIDKMTRAYLAYNFIDQIKWIRKNPQPGHLKLQVGKKSYLWFYITFKPCMDALCPRCGLYDIFLSLPLDRSGKPIQTRNKRNIHRFQSPQFLPSEAAH